MPPPVAHLLQPLQDLAHQVLVAAQQREGVQDEVLLLCNDITIHTKPPGSINIQHVHNQHSALTGDLPELLAAVEVLLGGAVAQRLDDLEAVLLVVARPPVRHPAVTLYLSMSGQQ